MIIGSAAHFVVCECGQHGRVVLADGKTSSEVTCKDEAMMLVEAAVARGWISGFELPELKRQIATSPLPQESGQETPQAILTASLTNFIALMLPGTKAEFVTAEDRHREYQQRQSQTPDGWIH